MLVKRAALIVGMAMAFAGCSFGGGGGRAASSGPALSSYQVTTLMKPRLAKVGHGVITGTQCAVYPHRRAKCDFGFAPGVGGALLLSAWFQFPAEWWRLEDRSDLP
jgi:hypothetical protein